MTLLTKNSCRGLAILLIASYLSGCGASTETQAATSVAPTPTFVPTPSKSLPEEILFAIDGGVRSSDEFLLQLEKKWFVNADFFNLDGEDVRISGSGNWDGFLLNTEAVSTGEAILASFQITDGISAEIGFRVATLGLGANVAGEKTTFGVYLNPGDISSSLWDNHTFINNADVVEFEGDFNLVPGYSYNFFGAIGDSSGIIVIWDQGDPSSYAIYSPQFLDGWNYPGWHFFVNTNQGSVILENYQEWLITFNTAGIGEYVSTSTDALSLDETIPQDKTPIPVPKSSYESSITPMYIDTSRNSAIGYADFNQDGLADILIANRSGTTEKIPISMYVQNPNGSFDEDISLLPFPLPGTVDPRKIIIADFNSDNLPDAFIADHGFDQPPFPGAEPMLLLSTNEGLEVGQIPNIPTGFHHSATAADITGDGSPDIFVTDPANGSFLLLNDGSGQFTLSRSGLPTIRGGYYTSELIDLDDDGLYDLLVGGHEYDGAVTRVYWGAADGTFSMANSTRIPSDEDYQIVLDFDAEDLDGDGTRELVITRTKSEPFYQGFYFQMLKITEREITDVSFRIVPDRAAWEGSTAQWVIWIILRDFNEDGYLDLVNPNRGRSMIFLNNGEGFFSREP